MPYMNIDIETHANLLLLFGITLCLARKRKPGTFFVLRLGFAQRDFFLGLFEKGFLLAVLLDPRVVVGPLPAAKRLFAELQTSAPREK